MRHRGFGMLGGNIRMAHVAVIDGFFQFGGTGFKVLFLFASSDDSPGERVLQRCIGMFDQHIRVTGFTVLNGCLGMLECGRRVLF